MTTYTYVGASLPNYKSVQVTPGPNATSQAAVSIGLGPYQVTTTGWNAAAIAALWNGSANAQLAQVVATTNGNNLVLTSNVLGQDFEVTCSINGAAGVSVSTLMTLTFIATGGTFTLSDGTLTTGDITYSATTATLVASIQTAINALSGYSSGDVVVTYNIAGYYQLDFSQGRFAGLAVSGWSVSGTSLTGGTAVATIVETQQGNVGADENITVTFPAAGTHTQNVDTIQTITMGATGSPSAGTFTLSIPSFGTTAAITFNAGRSAIKTAIENLVGFMNTIIGGGPLATGSPGSAPWTGAYLDGSNFDYYYNNASSGGTALTATNSGGPIASSTTATYTNLIGFSNVTIPQGKTVLDTVQMLYANNGNASPITLTIKGVKQANSAYPTTVTAAQALPLTTASVSVTIPGNSGSPGVGAPVSVDLTAIIQELVNQGSWASGNNIIFVLSGGATLQINAAYVFGINTTPTSSPLNGNYQSAATYTYLPVTVEFTGTLAGTAISAMTVNSSLTGGTASVTLTQAGGSQTVNNITGGTWSLQLVDPTNQQVYNINGIPYNVSAASLETLINGVCGSGSATVTGGPAPGSTLTIAFTGGMGNRTLNESAVPSFLGNFNSSSNLTTVRSAVAAPTSQNVWDMTVIPGEGTLAMNTGDPLTTHSYIILTIAEASTTDPSYYINNSVYIPLCGINPTQIENAINESLGSEAVRVTRVVHSIEQGLIPANQVVGSINNSAQDLHFWYYRDVFRLTFCGAYLASSSIEAITVVYPQVGGVAAGPLVWMVGSGPGSGTEPPQGSDALDFYPESERTYLGFTNYYQEANSSNQPSGNNQGPQFDNLSIVYNPNKTPSQLCYRAKLFKQYPPGLVTPPAANKIGGTINRAGLAHFNSNQVVFTWCQYTTPLSITDVSTGFTTLLATPSLPWNSTPEEIQAALSVIFGVGNVLVTGSLYNSWLSESLADSANPQTTYNDLRIYIQGQLNGIPLTDYGYGLQATITSAVTATVSPMLWIEEVSKVLPGGVNNRQRFILSNPGAVSNLTLTINNITISGLTPATTVAQLQTLINSTFGTLPLGGGSFGNSSAPLNFPAQAAQAAVVFGTTLAAPFEIEFTGLGLQFANQTMNLGVLNDAEVITLSRNTTGSYPIAEIQRLTISGSPHGGTYTVHGSGNIAYNAIASAIQTAIGSAPPTVTGTFPTFLLTWPSSDGPVTLWTTTSALNNSSATLNLPGSGSPGTQLGGAGASTGVVDVTVGQGPLYYDCPANYSPIGVPGANDTVIIDDATTSIQFGLAQTSNFNVVSISPAIFQHKRNRQVFQNGQKVYLSGSGTPPSGMTFGTAYYVIAQTASYTFSLSATLGGSAITITTIGAGSFWLATKNVVFNLYSRYSGGQIGLPNTNTATSLPEYLPKYLQLSGVTALIGIGSGDGIDMLRLDGWNDQASITVNDTGSSPIDNVPACLLLFNNADSILDEESGDVGIAFYSNEMSLLGTMTIHGGDLVLNAVTASLLQSAAGVPVTMTNCNISDIVSLG